MRTSKNQMINKWYQNSLSLYFPLLLLGTRSLEIEALGIALEVLKGLEVLEVDVLEDDAIFDLRPDGRAAET